MTVITAAMPRATRSGTAEFPLSSQHARRKTSQADDAALVPRGWMAGALTRELIDGRQGGAHAQRSAPASLAFFVVDLAQELLHALGGVLALVVKESELGRVAEPDGPGDFPAKPSGGARQAAEQRRSCGWAIVR